MLAHVLPLNSLYTMIKLFTDHELQQLHKMYLRFWESVFNTVRYVRLYDENERRSTRGEQLA